jgi:DNA-binding beta-propeller fold protein YncE
MIAGPDTSFSGRINDRDCPETVELCLENPIPMDVTRVSGGESLNERSKATAITPDGKYVYATTGLCSSASFDCFRPEAIYYALWVIDTATNKVVAASPGKGISDGIAFTPDGLHTYFTNFDPGLASLPLS